MNIFFWKKKNIVGTNFKDLYENKVINNIPLIKKNILGITSVLLFSIFSFFLSSTFLGLKPLVSSGIIASIFLIFGLIFLFFMLFVMKTKELLTWILLILAGIAVPFYKSFILVNFVTFCGLTITVLLIFYGSYKMHSEAENYIKFRWKRFVKAGANYIVFGILIFIMLVFYQKFLLENKNTQISMTNYSFFILEKSSSFIPYFSLNSPVDNLLDKTIETPAIKGYLASSGIVSLLGPEGTKSMLKDNLGKMIGQTLTGKESILEIMKNYVNSISDPTIRAVILGVLFFLIFSFLNLAFFALNLIAIPLGWVILKILLLTKFFTFKTLNVEQQTLSIE